MHEREHSHPHHGKIAGPERRGGKSRERVRERAGEGNRRKGRKGGRKESGREAEENRRKRLAGREPERQERTGEAGRELGREGVPNGENYGTLGAKTPVFAPIGHFPAPLGTLRHA